MATARYNHVRIRGISSVYPAEQIENATLNSFPSEDIQKTCDITGVRYRHVTDSATCTSDLCAEAWTRLKDALPSPIPEIDALIFVSQTPDHTLPATACLLQHRLGLPTSTLAFDINQGCSGYVIGLMTAASLIESGQLKSALLLVGDTVSKFVSDKDPGTSLLFGDAGTATLLTHDPSAEPMTFLTGTDGEGGPHLIIPKSGFRQQNSQSEASPLRGADQLYMHGGEVFNFTLKRIPKLVRQTAELAETPLDAHDGFVFHQANQFMLKHLQKKLKLAPEKCLSSIEHYGNTSSASIPITLTHCYDQLPQDRALTMGFFGFGVGFSWAGVSLTLPQDLTICHHSVKGVAHAT